MSKAIKFLTLSVSASVMVCVLAGNALAQDLPTINSTQLTFSDALKIAASNNLDIKIAKDSSDIAAANASSASSALSPSLSTTTYGAYGDSSNILSSSPGVAPQNIFAVPSSGFADQNLTLALPLYTGGKLQNQRLSSRLAEQSSVYSTASAKLTVNESVIEDYANAALDNQLIEVAQARLDEENEQVKNTQLSVDEGHSAPVDLLREQAEQSDAAQAVVGANNNEQDALVELKYTLGVSQSSTIGIVDSLDSLLESQLVPATLNSALKAADSSSPALKSMALSSKAATADVTAAKASFSPQVYGVAMGDAMSMRGGSRTGYTIGLSASLPLYDGGQRSDEVGVATAKLNSARDQELKAQQDVDKAVAEAFLNQQSAEAEMDSATKGVDAAQQSYTLADLRYNAGKSIAVERFDALTALVRAKETLASSKLALIVAKAKLIEAIGG